MRNRQVQRELRRTIGKEERIERTNYYGNQDLTPYQAVEEMIRKERARVIAESRKSA